MAASNFVVVYRIGGTVVNSWRRTLAYSTHAAAVEAAASIRRGGRPAFVDVYVPFAPIQADTMEALTAPQGGR